MELKKIEIVRGNTYTRQITCTANDGTPRDMTGKTLLFMVKKSLNDPDTSALITKTMTDFIGTIPYETTIDITSEDSDITPNTYKFEFREDYSPNRKVTRKIGDFIISNNLIKL